MKNLNSVSPLNFSGSFKKKDIDFDSKSNVKFRYKWLSIKESVQLEQFIQPVEGNEKNNQVVSDPLLTLLCLLFEEKAEIPSERCLLYKEALEILLKKWDDKRQIDSDWIYKNLSLQRKQDLLSKIALLTFEWGEYFFKQELEQYIADYICNLPDAPKNPELLQLASQATLKSIELQHELLVEQIKGIYSFSDCKFHQYFAARELAEISEPRSSEKALKNLVSHLSEPRWREVFLLLVGMLRSADYLLSLIKQQTDAIVAVDPQLHNFLLWLNQKSHTSGATHKPATFRAFYLEFILDVDLADSLEDELTDYQNVNSPWIDTSTCELQNFPFSQAQKALLRQYYDANQLLLACLNQARFVSRAVREEIEQTLLVPSELENKTKSAIA